MLNNNILNKTKQAIKYFDPGFVFCFMVFITSLAVIGLFSIGFKFVQEDIIQISVPITMLSQPQISVVSEEQPAISSAEQAKTLVTTIKSKDSLARIFKRLGLDPKDATAILALKQARVLKGMQAGKQLSIVLAETALHVKKLTYPVDDLNTLVITSHNGWRAKIDHIEPVGNFKYVAAHVKGSVYSAMRNAGISRKMMAQLESIFSSKVNFRRLNKGDRLAVFYKEYTVHGKKIKEGNIAAAEVVHNGNVHRLIGFTDPRSNITNYYTPDGMGIKPPFVRFPVKYDRISSRFSWNRYHPILHIIRPHTGVDLSARAGTPIIAAGSGRISFAGNKSGYGRAIIIKHGGKYSTLYGHLLRFSKKACSGCYVRQGEVIGYVGSSGLATSPHLHYEFHINDIPHDPLRVKLPEGEMIPAEYRRSFFALAKRMLAQLDLHNRDNRMLA